jgi:hypothetical protein
MRERPYESCNGHVRMIGSGELNKSVSLDVQTYLVRLVCASVLISGTPTSVVGLLIDGDSDHLTDLGHVVNELVLVDIIGQIADEDGAAIDLISLEEVLVGISTNLQGHLLDVVGLDLVVGILAKSLSIDNQ